MQEKSLFYQGAWHVGHGDAMQSFNPATGHEIWSGISANAGDVDAAVQSAREAFGGWSKTNLDERLSIVKSFCDRVEKEKKELALLITSETGKPLWDSEGEVTALLGKITHTVRAYHERTGTHKVEGEIVQELQHRPHGVFAVLGPYNFPAHLPNGHIMPALIAGNTVVLKPSEETPNVAEWMVKHWQEAGLPNGVLNLVQGGRSTGEMLVGHADINGVLFTGSYPTGKALHKALAGRVEIVLALEMGGNNPLIVWDVADVAAAATLIVQSAYISSGQRCTCARKLIIPQGVQGDAIIEALQARIDTIRVGDPMQDTAPFMGTLIHNRVVDSLLNVQQELEQNGGVVLRSMRRLHAGKPYLTAGLMDVTACQNLKDEEYFGPFLQVVRVKDWGAALMVANATSYGLAAGLLSDDKKLWDEFHKEIRAGVVNWNRPTTGASSGMPFGGTGWSGNHRPSAYYAADYCAYPIASMFSDKIAVPAQITGLDVL